MRKIVSVLLLCVGLILGGCGGAGLDGVNDDYKFDNLNAQIAVIDGTLDGLQAQLTTLAGVSAEGDAALQAQIDVLKADLLALKARVAANEEDITVLQADATTLTARVDDVEDRLDVLEAAMDLVPKANSPLFASVVITETDTWFPYWPGAPSGWGYWKDVQNPAATIVWTASAGGETAASYNIYAVPVSDNGALGVPFKIANGTGTEYFFNGHLEELPVDFMGAGVNPAPLQSVVEEPPDTCGGVYRFAVTAVDGNGNESAPSVSAEAKYVIATPPPPPPVEEIN